MLTQPASHKFKKLVIVLRVDPNKFQMYQRFKCKNKIFKVLTKFTFIKIVLIWKCSFQIIGTIQMQQLKKINKFHYIKI